MSDGYLVQGLKIKEGMLMALSIVTKYLLDVGESNCTKTTILFLQVFVHLFAYVCFIIVFLVIMVQMNACFLIATYIFVKR